MRASRLVSILLLLQTRGPLTAQQIADELEVSLRTVYRDVESLSEAGVPVYGDRGPAGGYRLAAGYRTRLTGLTAEEAESLALAGLPGPAAELGLGTVLAAAELKLLAALPPELRSRAARIRDGFHLDAPGWFRDGDDPVHLAAVAEAVWNQHAIRVRYRPSGGEPERTRTLHPLGIVLKGGTWYTVAARDGQLRTYRVSRILELEPLEDRFERPEGFDLASFWAARTEEWEASIYDGQATLRLSPRGLRLLPSALGSVPARAAHAGEPDEAGWTEVTVPIGSLEDTEFDLLRLGEDVEVLQPPELRERMAHTAAALAKVYG